MNTSILFAEIVITFTAVVLAAKYFGEYGLTAWVAFATVAANIMTAKNSVIFGMDAATGSVLFASTFLATDILCERYGAHSARRAVYIGLASIIAFTVSAQITLAYTPSAFDYADGPMHVLFGLNLRISIASAVMYFVANIADVALFEGIRKKTGGRLLWLRNNVSTILCNCAENFAFIFLAFAGTYSAEECMIIAASTSLIEAVVAVCDTPFLYVATGRQYGKVTQ